MVFKSIYLIIMKKLFLSLSLLTSIFISTQVLSDELKNDADYFKGLNIGLGLSILKYNSHFFQDNNVNSNSTNIVPRFDGSYSFKLTDKWLLGVGLTFDLSPFNGDSYAYDDYNSLKIRTTNHYSLYVQPTYTINNTLGLFSKLSYQSSNIYALWTCPSSGVGSGCFDDHMRLDGVGVGLGIKKIVGENMYIQVEGEYVDYADKNYVYNTVTGRYNNNNSYSGTLSVGYHF